MAGPVMVCMFIVVLSNSKIEVCLYTDINECAEDTDGCAQICTNMVGNYTCSCRVGYRLAADSHWCAGKSHAQHAGELRNKCHNLLDIDECMEDTDACHQLCTNTVGSYTCSCRTGYQLASDDLNCDGNVCLHVEQK